MIPLAELVDVEPLLEAIWTSIVFGLGVVIIAAIGVSASLRAADDRSEHEEGGFVGWGLVSIVCVVGLVAAVVLGIWAMTQ